MRVCAHYNVGGSSFHHRHHSIADAVADLRTAHDAMGFDTIIRGGEIVQQSTLDVSMICPDCTSNENYHDYPESRFVIGLRGGIARVTL